MTILKEYDDDKKHIHVLSYGGGTQSTALLLMALKGEINGVIPDYVIFADTGWEPRRIYDWIKKVNDYIKTNFGKEIIITQKRNLRDDVLTKDNGKPTKHLVIPAFMKHPDGKIGMGRRLCTADYKIEPIKKEVRSLLGYEPRKRVREIVHMWKGISTDEINRVKPMRDKWIIAEHPLIDIVDIDRTECIKYVENEGLGTPEKSSCIGCPYHDQKSWYDMKMNDPESWEDAVMIDEKLRDGVLKNENYLHPTCVPLKDLDFSGFLDMDSFDSFGNECEGMCGV